MPEFKQTIQKDLAKFHEEFYELFEYFVDKKGANPFIGRLFAMFLIDKHPKLQKDLSEQLNVSVSTISRTLKTLEENWGVLKRSRVSGSKEWKYSAKSTSIPDIYLKAFTSQLKFARQSLEMLKSLRVKWFSLSKNTKETNEAKNTLQVLDELIDVVNIAIDELEQLINRIEQRFKGIIEKRRSISISESIA